MSISLLSAGEGMQSIRYWFPCLVDYFWRRTAPSPYDEASAETNVSAFGSCNASPGGDVSSFLILSKTSCCWNPMPRCSNPSSGLHMDRFSSPDEAENCPDHFSFPAVLSLHWYYWVFSWLSPTTFSLLGSALTLDASMTCPRNLILLLETSLSVTLASWSHDNTVLSLSVITDSYQLFHSMCPSGPICSVLRDLCIFSPCLFTWIHHRWCTPFSRLLKWLLLHVV